MADTPRSTFETFELAIVLSHYNLGAIESITDFTRGSRRSPKAGIVCEAGKFLLKRRAAVRSIRDRVAFAHRVQHCLAAFEFPLAKLVTTRDGRSTFLMLREHVYELFQFVAGQSFDQSPEQARLAGETLAHFHEATENFVAAKNQTEPRGDYHDSTGVRTGLCNLGPRISEHDSFAGKDAELASHLHNLLKRYDQAAEFINRLGFKSWPDTIVHSDWHPGNLLFRGGKVVAVVDFDAARWSRSVTDVANGALQFSMQSAGDIDLWAPDVDLQRFNSFLAGYHARRPLSENDCRAVPYLMCEALIAECVAPIAETGSVGPWPGFRVLCAIRKKVDWIAANIEQLTHATTIKR